MKKPSISELLSILDKPALLNWANKQGLKGIDISKERQKWLNDGTSIHYQIENFIKNKTPFINSEHEKSFIKFISEYEILDCEKNIETDWFVGRYDLKVEKDNEIKIIDFKNNQKGIYLENKLQLVGYAMAEKCNKLSVVSAPDFIEIPIHIINFEPYIEILKALSIIYSSKLLL